MFLQFGNGFLRFSYWHFQCGLFIGAFAFPGSTVVAVAAVTSVSFSFLVFAVLLTAFSWRLSISDTLLRTLYRFWARRSWHAVLSLVHICIASGTSSWWLPQQEVTITVKYFFHWNSQVVLKQYCSFSSIVNLVSCSYIVDLADVEWQRSFWFSP